MSVLPPGWTCNKLGKLVKFTTGKLNSNAATTNGKYPFFTCSRETYLTNTYSFNTEAVLLAGNNANGIYPLKYYNGKFDAYQRTYVITSLNQDVVTNRYIFYALMPQLEHLQTISTGAATKFLTLTLLNCLEVCLPPPSTQRRIASILSAYDDLIENNTRRIAILEEIARRLYEEWFVHFRFPGHETARFVETELGPVPEGWEVGTLKDIVVLQRGYDLPSKLRNNGPYPVIASTGPSTTHSEAKVKAPCVVTGRSGSIGKVMYISKDFWPLNTTLYGKSYPLNSIVFAYFVLQSIDFNVFNSGAAVPSLNRNNIHKLPFALPSKAIVKNFEKNVEPLFTLKENLQAKNANLRAQRDRLLPKLISGELDVSEAEEVFAEVAV